MKNLLTFSLCSVLLFALSACGGSGTETDAVGKTRHAFTTFSLEAPEDWRKITKESFGNSIPSDTVVILLKKHGATGFIQNANIVKESLNTDATSLEYAKANLLLGSKAILDYRPVSSDEVELGGIKTVFHLFQARSSTTEPLYAYAQAYFARDRLGYTVTCISEQADAVQAQNCEALVKSFRFEK